MNKFKMALIVCWLLNFIFFSGTESASANSIDSADIEIFMDKMMQEKMKEQHIPNATVSVVSNGKVILEKGYGYANVEDQTVIDPEKTMFRMGSVSKLFTWTAVMQLVERGMLDLDTDVNEYLDFEIPTKLEGAQQGDTEPITLHHLMTHTPGFEDYADSIFRLSADKAPSLEEYVRQYKPARVFPPGEVMAYSNYGTALAGYIVEQVSGMPFPEYVEKNIYQPLGMKHSTFLQPLPEKLSPHMVQGYRYVNGEYLKGDFEFVPEPAGSMSSTASDMAKFMLAYLQGGKSENGRILEEKTVQQMFRQQFTHHDRLDGMAIGFIEKTTNNERILFHGGNTMLFDNGLYLLPHKNTGLFISYSGSNYLAHTDIFQAFMDRYFSSEQSATPVPFDGTTDYTKKLAGEYHQNRKSFTTSERMVSLTMGIIRMDVDENGDLIVNHAGELNRFLEIEPGVYHNLREGSTPDAYGEFRTIVFKTDPFGHIMLTTDGPMTYSKAPWYATSSITFLSIMMAVLLFIGGMVAWSVGWIITKIKRKKAKQSKGAITARWVANAFGLLISGFLFGIAITGEIHPVYGLPKVALGILPAWSPLVALFPYGMALLAVAMSFFTVLVWRKKYWQIFGRIHYTLLTLLALNLIWILVYWHLI